MASWWDYITRIGGAPQMVDDYGRPVLDAYAAQPESPQAPLVYAQNNPAIGTPPMPPQRPDQSVPLPPGRPGDIVPQAPAVPFVMGDPMGTDSQPFAGLQAQPGAAPAANARSVPLPPQRPQSFAVMPDLGPRRFTSGQGAPRARQQAAAPAPAQAAPQASQALSQGSQAGAQSVNGSVFGWNTSHPGIFNGLFAQGPAQGNPASVGTTGPQIPAPTGLAAFLGADPSMQAQTSTGPTAFLDRLFGFRG